MPETEKGDKKEATVQPSPKWWHVADEDIQDMLCTMLTPLAEKKVAGKLQEGVPDASWAKDALDKLVGTGPDGEEDAVHEDALPTLPVKAAQQQGKQQKKNPSWRPWHVSDEALEDLVRSMVGQHSPGPSASLKETPKELEPARRNRRGSIGHIDHRRLSRSEPLPCPQADKRHLGARSHQPEDFMIIYIYDTDTQQNVPLQVTGDLHIGPPENPKGNRFTDVWGAAASTAGFAELRKEFDHRHRVWSDAPQQQVSLQWTTSLKSLIEEETGVPIAKQRLIYKGSPITGDSETVQFCGLYNGETIQLFRKKDTAAKRDQVLLASTRRAMEKQAEAAKKPKPTSKLRMSAVQTGIQLVQPKWIHHTGGGKSSFTQIGDGKKATAADHAPEWGTTGVYTPLERDRTSASALERIRHSTVFSIPAAAGRGAS
eukprot:CAMPEP_0178410264 /NCGR_PEP_ID=MMETSP0689_2-20121128/20888_1 /TAXON_ID=160604 /ORGANISM="Amphidinium massartii, Strain CS-259" /LENGTH=428 /DNA_ID=CAMNT_0020031431 /DNA_START=31 /DNA_END=1313 /DNA_ORIENTATION=-